MGIAWGLGAHALTQEVVRAFVTNALGQARVSPRTDFGTVAAASWVAELRKSDTPMAAHALVVELREICGSEDQWLNLVLQIYGGLPRRRDIGDVTRAELLRRLLGSGHGCSTSYCGFLTCPTLAPASSGASKRS